MKGFDQKPIFTDTVIVEPKPIVKQDTYYPPRESETKYLKRNSSQKIVEEIPKYTSESSKYETDFKYEPKY